MSCEGAECEGYRRCETSICFEPAGRLTKVPYVPGRPTQRAKVSDPSTWGSFSAALQDYKDGKCDGIGFVLGDGVTGGRPGQVSRP